MANVVLPSGVFVDLYDATGITVGTQIRVHVLSPNDVTLYDTAAQPVPATNDHQVATFRGDAFVNASGDAGAWAVCVGGGAIDVQEV